MTNDIERRRRANLRAERRARWVSRVGEFSYSVSVSWPKGPLGWLFAVGVAVCPVGLLMLCTWVAQLLLRRRGGEDGTGES